MIDIDETLKLTQSQGQGSRSIPAGKHFWKYKNVHLYQTGATDIFTRRKCPCYFPLGSQRKAGVINIAGVPAIDVTLVSMTKGHLQMKAYVYVGSAVRLPLFVYLCELFLIFPSSTYIIQR